MGGLPPDTGGGQGCIGCGGRYVANE